MYQSTPSSLAFNSEKLGLWKQGGIIRYVFIFFLLLITLSRIEGSEIKGRAEKIISEQFGEGIKVEFKKLELTSALKKKIESKARQRFFRNVIYSWRILKADTLVGYALLDNVKGKSLPITFLVLFDKEGTILNTHVVKYREAIGGEIGNKRWNIQFAGRNSQSTFAIGKEIDGISGATISVNAMSRGIYKLAILIEMIREDL